jgi:HlyD family secretion protein
MFLRPRTILLLLVLIASGALGWTLLRWKSQPVEVQFARATVATIHTAVPTNGKVEPIDWAIAKAERAGPVIKIMLQRGQNVAEGAPLVEIDASEARASLSAAQAKMADARAQLDMLQHGGRASDLAEISAGIERAKLDLARAQEEYDRDVRLEQKQAGTRAEVEAARHRIEQAKLQINMYEQRRPALVSPSDRAAAQARFDDAQASAKLAEQQIAQSVVRAPIEGTVYQFDLKPGAYLNPGDAVASIGRLDRVKVNVYVDEPDLGRVSKGMPVVINWVAMPARHWEGEVDRTATQIVQLGTRQVGEVVCVIRNPDRDLLPGTNVDVEIRSETVENAVTIPKEAVHTERGQTGVYLLSGDHIAWKPVKLGVANTTRTQVKDGISTSDAVALFSENPLHDGMQVKPVFP